MAIKQVKKGNGTPVTSNKVVDAEMGLEVWPEIGVKPRNTLKVVFSTGAMYKFSALEDEDSNDGFWNAKLRGNGQGKSFVNVDGDAYVVPAGDMPGPK